MQRALLIVLTGALCVEGAVSDLPQCIDVPLNFVKFVKYLVDHTLCGLWSSMHIWTLSALLQRLLPPDTLKGFVFISATEHPNSSVAYPNPVDFIKYILRSPTLRHVLRNQSIRLLEVDPLIWPVTRLLEPCLKVTDDVDPLFIHHPYYVLKEIIVSETVNVQQQFI